jgi:type VI secretion system protein ImpK
MMTVISEQEIIARTEDDFDEPSIATAITHFNPTTQLLLSSKLIPHTPDAGLNPLVDFAAYLFSLMGKLKHIKTYRNLSKLRDELIHEIGKFQENANAFFYNTEYVTEYIPVACYAICLTIDDIISETPWGNGGRWEKYSLLTAYNQDSISRESFFIILERLVSDPEQYIDVMEFMYLCLSFGFKGQTTRAIFNHEQLKHIVNSLYKRIRAYRGDFTKTLSPYSIKPRAAKPEPTRKKIPVWAVIAASAALILVMYAGTQRVLNHHLAQPVINVTVPDK